MMQSRQDDELNCPCLTPAVGRRAGDCPGYHRWEASLAWSGA